MNFPDRGRSLEMPPREPLVYRLYEIVQNYGYAYKSVINEKFGDGIMSAISFSTKVEKETDEKGEWVKITLRGKWYVVTPCCCAVVLGGCGLTSVAGFLSLASRFRSVSVMSVYIHVGKHESFVESLVSIFVQFWREKDVCIEWFLKFPFHMCTRYAKTHCLMSSLNCL